MMCSAFFGELSEERKIDWHHNDKNPYAVLNDPVLLENKGHKLLDEGNKYFRDRIQIDWGSFAWKCTREEILKFLDEHRETLPWLVKDDEQIIETVRLYISERGNVLYGVVFTEEA